MDFYHVTNFYSLDYRLNYTATGSNLKSDSNKILTELGKGLDTEVDKGVDTITSR